MKQILCGLAGCFILLRCFLRLSQTIFRRHFFEYITSAMLLGKGFIEWTIHGRIWTIQWLRSPSFCFAEFRGMLQYNRNKIVWYVNVFSSKTSLVHVWLSLKCSGIFKVFFKVSHWATTIISLFWLPVFIILILVILSRDTGGFQSSCLPSLHQGRQY